MKSPPSCECMAGKITVIFDKSIDKNARIVHNKIIPDEKRGAMSLEAIALLFQAAVVSGYTSWKWYIEWQDRKEKKRLKDKGDACQQKPKS